MGSIVIELQKELLDNNCDILQALRKAHLIASKLSLKEFDAWILNELNGYKSEDENLPDYRQVKGTLKAKNPYHGWIPAVITDQQGKALFNTVPMLESVSALIDIEKKAKDGQFYYICPPELSMKIAAYARTPAYMEIALFISTVYITEAIDKVKNCLLEWTLELERKGILGENMTFNENETASAKEIPQQTNYYYGTVIQGNVSDSQITSGNNNTITYNSDIVSEALKEIQESLKKEHLTKDDMESALELLGDISTKLEQNKKPSIIKSALVGLKDFVLAAGANITAALITAKIQGLF